MTTRVPTDIIWTGEVRYDIGQSSQSDADGLHAKQHLLSLVSPPYTFAMHGLRRVQSIVMDGKACGDECDRNKTSIHDLHLATQVCETTVSERIGVLESKRFTCVHVHVFVCHR